MVVLVIMVVMSSLVVVSMGPVLGDARLRTGCRMLVSMMSYARSFAVTHRTDTLVVFDRSKPGISVRARAQDKNDEEQFVAVTTPPGRYRRLPQGVTIVRVQKPGTTEGASFAGFSELGQSDGAIITIRDRRGKERVIVLDRVTGRCEILTGQSQ
jgi:Tfp pilus assembly protein FimT